MFTVPAEFSSKLHNFSSEGLRVLALAYKPLDGNTNLRTIERWEPRLYFWLPTPEACNRSSRTEMDAAQHDIQTTSVTGNSCVSFHRGEVEKDMQFLGFLMMKNLVKPESAKVINILRLAHLRSVMVTGERCFAFELNWAE